jgi:hypothetical protein
MHACVQRNGFASLLMQLISMRAQANVVLTNARRFVVRVLRVIWLHEARQAGALETAIGD